GWRVLPETAIARRHAFPRVGVQASQQRTVTRQTACLAAEKSSFGRLTSNFSPLKRSGAAAQSRHSSNGPPECSVRVRASQGSRPQLSRSLRANTSAESCTGSVEPPQHRVQSHCSSIILETAFVLPA